MLCGREFRVFPKWYFCQNHHHAICAIYLSKHSKRYTKTAVFNDLCACKRGIPPLNPPFHEFILSKNFKFKDLK